MFDPSLIRPQTTVEMLQIQSLNTSEVSPTENACAGITDQTLGLRVGDTGRAIFASETWAGAEGVVVGEVAVTGADPQDELNLAPETLVETKRVAAADWENQITLSARHYEERDKKLENWTSTVWTPKNIKGDKGAQKQERQQTWRK